MPPAIDNQTASDRNLSVVIGGKIVIDCPVSGTPQPEVTWFKDNEPISPEVNIQLYDYNRRLEVQTKHVSDAGLYTCIGTNDAGNTTRDFYLDIYGNILNSITNYQY